MGLQGGGAKREKDSAEDFGGEVAEGRTVAGSKRDILRRLMSCQASTFTQWELGYMHGAYYGKYGGDTGVVDRLMAKAGICESQEG